ncbi:hypothetical protein Spla01_01805 [Streptomyces platensis]|uniref:Lipoprotein n=1 Tax=Streptomyces platensis TaxID=58346 RepID=A0ABX3Y475_STRPT|nr:hypothetical protein [Streptomyces platensis]OSY47926.1 hypothetical protein BG653_00559 [Streptomyces platensis]
MSAMNALKALRTVRARRLVLGGALTGALAAALSGALAGCGIAPTDVIDAGEPASGMKSPGQPEADVQLFFYGPSGLRSATRPAKTPVDPDTALQLLMKGPNHAERMRGLTSVLPKFLGLPSAETREGAVVINVRVGVELLDSASLNQLVCTAANARVPGDKPAGQVAVMIVGKAGRVGPMVCGGNNAFPVVEPSPTPTAPSATQRPDTGDSGTGGSAAEPDPTG